MFAARRWATVATRFLFFAAAAAAADTDRFDLFLKYPKSYKVEWLNFFSKKD